MARENIVLVTIDSLRADFVAGNAAKTENLDTLRDESIVYENAFSQGPFTTFSMPSLFTSRYPSGLGYLEFSESTIGVYIEDEPTLPNVLRDNGYETAGFHSNPLLSNLFGFDLGFETFDARLPFANTDVLPGRAKILADKAFRLVRKHPYLPAEKVNERAFNWLDRHDGSEPFFLWIHYMDVHGPYIAKDGNAYLNKYRGERLWRKAITQPDELSHEERVQLKELYREEIEYTDARLGELFDELRDRGLWDETVVTVTADHGEGFGEHGTFSHPHDLYDELTHVPLIVRDPNREPGRVDRPVELTDVAPTLVERAGATRPESFTGEPLPQDDDGGDAIAISEADLVPEYTGSVRTSRYRYIRNGVKGTEELFDVREDPLEQCDVSDEHPDVHDKLAGILDEHLSERGRDVGHERDVTQGEIQNGEVRNRLHDLGYLE